VKWPELAGWLRGMPGAIDGTLRGVGDGPLAWLHGTGHDTISGLQRGGDLGWREVMSPWLQQVPGAIQNAVGDAGQWLVGKGHDLFNGLKIGADESWATSFSPWLSQIPSAISSGIGDLTGSVKSIGA